MHHLLQEWILASVRDLVSSIPNPSLLTGKQPGSNDAQRLWLNPTTSSF